MVLLAAAVALQGSPSDGATTSFSLSPHGGSGVRGTAVIRSAPGGATVALRLRGLSPTARAQAFVRAGSCARPAPRYATLPAFTADVHGKASTTSSFVKRGKRKVPYSGVTRGTFVLTVEQGRRITACGRIPRSTPTTTMKGKGTGGSTANCSPSCTAGSPQFKQITANDGSGYQVSFSYSVVRPRGLTNSPSNLAPLLVQFRSTNDTYWAATGAANRFVVVNVTEPPNCGKACGGYNIRTISPNAANVRPLNSCGAPPGGQPYGTGGGACDLKYELKAILDREIPAQNIDPNKVFVTGSSRGGTAAEDAICDPLTSHYFRGAFIISANFFAGKKVAGTATIANSPPLCPALTSAPKNDDISVKYIHGTNDNGVPDNGHLVRWPDGTTSWYFSQLQNLVNFWNPALGCTSHTTTMFGSPTAANTRDTFSSCRRPYRATELDTISGGNHGCPNSPGLDGFNGSDCRVEGWTFLASH